MVLPISPAMPLVGCHVGSIVGKASIPTATMIRILSLELFIVSVVFVGLEDVGETGSSPIAQDAAGFEAGALQCLDHTVGSLGAKGS